MNFFNSFRQHIYQFFTGEERDESIVMQPVLNKEVLKLMKRFGGTSNSFQSVEFFFYSDTEDKANNLAIELNKLNYEVYGVSQSFKENEWSIIGCTPALNLNDESLNAWSKQMVDLGFKCDCKFDGWGTLIE